MITSGLGTSAVAKYSARSSEDIFEVRWQMLALTTICNYYQQQIYAPFKELSISSRTLIATVVAQAEEEAAEKEEEEAEEEEEENIVSILFSNVMLTCCKIRSRRAPLLRLDIFNRRRPNV